MFITKVTVKKISFAFKLRGYYFFKTLEDCILNPK